MPSDPARGLGRVARAPSAPLDLERVAKRAAALRRRRRAAVALVTVAVGTASFAVVRAPFGTSSRDVRPARRTQTYPRACVGPCARDQMLEIVRRCAGDRCAAAASTSSNVVGRTKERTSPVVLLGSGTEAGWPWSLRGWLRHHGEPYEDLCFEMLYGPKRKAASTCTDAPPGRAYDARAALVHEVPRAAYVGVVPEGARVEVRADDGGPRRGTVFESPAALGVDADVFVAFAPTGVDAEVRVIAPDGDVIGSERYEALGAVTVTRVGDGRGEVFAYTASVRQPLCEELASCGRSFQCPDRCYRGFEPGTRLALRARARDGSHFAGWDGACRGSELCTVVVDAHLWVVARFERE